MKMAVFAVVSFFCLNLRAATLDCDGTPMNSLHATIVSDTEFMNVTSMNDGQNQFVSGIDLKESSANNNWFEVDFGTQNCTLDLPSNLEGTRQFDVLLNCSDSNAVALEGMTCTVNL